MQRVKQFLHSGHHPDIQVKRHLCGGLQNDLLVCIPSLRIAYERTCGSAKVVYNNTQLNNKKRA